MRLLFVLKEAPMHASISIWMPELKNLDSFKYKVTIVNRRYNAANQRFRQK